MSNSFANIGRICITQTCKLIYDIGHQGHRGMALQGKIIFHFERLQNVINDIVGPDQVAYINNRFIGTNIRLVPINSAKITLPVISRQGLTSIGTHFVPFHFTSKQGI